MNVGLIDLVLRVAREAEGACESPPNSNAGPFVERILARVGLKKGDPWCAAFVYDAGANALAAQWPLPATGSCAALATYARVHGVLMAAPAVGDVFLIWHAELGRFAHAGFVIGPNSDTLSGNTSGAGNREGWLVGRRTWPFKPEDRFVRWAALIQEG